MKKPVVHAYFICYNEENILPHLLRHYLSFCEKVVILDNYSTDNSCKIVESFPNTEVIKYNSNNELNDGVYLTLKNNIWKTSAGVADYVIVGDTDEFLYHDNMIEFLKESKEKGVTIFKPEGYHMVADEELELIPSDNILELVKYGVRTEVLDKLMMFDCNLIKEINYSFGCHAASPLGHLVMSNDNNLKMLHYKFLGLKDHMLKQKVRAERLSQYNKERGLGLYYLMNEEEQKNDYRGYYNKRIKVLK